MCGQDVVITFSCSHDFLVHSQSLFNDDHRTYPESFARGCRQKVERGSLPWEHHEK